MRVISGLFKGRALDSPRSDLTHPMGEREKNALFNMLGDLSDQAVLDAFAGSGALGIEALSRGASAVVFVEKSPKIAGTIQKNLAKLVSDREKSPETAIFTLDVAKFAENPSQEASFDLIIADPPYDRYNPAIVAPLAQLLKPSGQLALSLPATAEPPILPTLTLRTQKKYANAKLAIYDK